MSEAVTSTGILVKRGLIVPTDGVAITAVTAANPTVITAVGHGLHTGDETTIIGTTSTPSVNGSWTVTVLDEDHFTIPVHVTVAGSIFGTVQQIFQVVGELTEVTPGGMSRNKIDTSTHNDGSESHVLGILRQTDPGMKINYVGSDATHVAVLQDLAANVKNFWKILFPSGVSRTGKAYVQQFTYDTAPVDGKQGATLSLTWASVVTEDAGNT